MPWLLWWSYPHDFKCFPEVISVTTLAAANLIAGFICTGAGASDSISFSSWFHCDIGGDCLSLAALEDNAAVFLPFSVSVSVLFCCFNQCIMSSFKGALFTNMYLCDDVLPAG